MALSQGLPSHCTIGVPAGHTRENQNVTYMLLNNKQLPNYVNNLHLVGSVGMVTSVWFSQ